jgi:hypothetical protein
VETLLPNEWAANCRLKTKDRKNYLAAFEETLRVLDFGFTFLLDRLALWRSFLLEPPLALASALSLTFFSSDVNSTL